MADTPVPDEALFAAMRAAVDRGAVAPSPASVRALRLAVLERWGDIETTTGRPRTWHWPRRSAVFAAVTAALTLGGGTVALARPALPGPLRDAARLVGLPVSPEPPARVVIERGELKRSLDAGNVPRIQADLQDLNRAESKLTQTEQVGARAADSDLERQARTILGGPAPAGEREGSRTGATPVPAEPEPTEAQPASSSPAPASSEDRSTTTAPAAPPPSGEQTSGDRSTAPAPPPPSAQESSTTTTSQPPSSGDDGGSTSTSSSGSEQVQTTPSGR